MKNMMKLHVILVGNPRDGYHVIGPFENGQAANDYEFMACEPEDWFVMPLEAPGFEKILS